MISTPEDREWAELTVRMALNMLKPEDSILILKYSDRIREAEEAYQFIQQHKEWEMDWREHSIQQTMKQTKNSQ